MNITLVYVYHTGDRPDRFQYAIGVVQADGPVIGDFAMFSDRESVEIAAEAIARYCGAKLSMLPSAASGAL